MNKDDLAAAVADKTDMSKAAATQAVEAVFGCITEFAEEGSGGACHRLRQFHGLQARGEHRPQSADRRAHADQGVQPGQVQARQGSEGHSEPVDAGCILQLREAPLLRGFSFCGGRRTTPSARGQRGRQLSHDFANLRD